MCLTIFTHKRKSNKQNQKNNMTQQVLKWLVFFTSTFVDNFIVRMAKLMILILYVDFVHWTGSGGVCLRPQSIMLFCVKSATLWTLAAPDSRLVRRSQHSINCVCRAMGQGLFRDFPKSSQSVLQTCDTQLSQGHTAKCRNYATPNRVSWGCWESRARQPAACCPTT